MTLFSISNSNTFPNLRRNNSQLTLKPFFKVIFFSALFNFTHLRLCILKPLRIG